MSDVSVAQRLTALSIGALCIVALLCAAPLLRFGLVGATQTGVAAAEAYAPLTNNDVVGALARQARFAAAPPAEAAQSVAELSDILALRPMSSERWLALARAQYAAGAPPEKYFQALSFSQLVGPNEASIMAGRAVFGLSLWSLAPADLRKAVIRDLVGGWPQVSETRRTLLNVMLSDAVPKAREEIASSLAARGGEGAMISARLGLARAP